jgi:hypothetical protein
MQASTVKIRRDCDCKIEVNEENGIMEISGKEHSKVL